MLIAISNAMQVYVHTNTHILRPSEDSEPTGLKLTLPSDYVQTLQKSFWWDYKLRTLV